MSENQPAPGSVMWTDLTVPDAEKVRSFYENVIGWQSSPVDMDGYNDYCMLPPGSDKPAVGICHARGENSNLPAQWLIYITVADLDRSLSQCLDSGGSVVAPIRQMASARMAVIRDPAGAVVALYQATPEGSG